MSNIKTRKLALAGVFVGVAVVGNFHFLFFSKCALVQHMVNIMCSILLGPAYSLAVSILLIGKDASNIAFYAYVIPFLISTVGGALLSTILISSLQRSKIFNKMQKSF